jgi:hypothetical protein
LKASNAISNRPGAAKGAAKAEAGAAGPAAPTNGASSSSTDEWFRLTGPSLTLDPRIHAYRDDIADIGLAGQVLAPHYARPLVRGCGSRATTIHAAPKDDSQAISELLPGEEFAVLEYAGGWAWGYARADHVTGYVEAIALTDPIEPTHVVCEKCAPVAPDGQITTVTAHLPMGARLHGTERGACLSTEYGCVSLAHLRPVGDREPDPVRSAERLMGVPYRAGGRTLEGIDGPGLIQLALSLAGLPAPHFTDQQRRLGSEVPDLAPSHRGDLVFGEEGGGGLMIDDLLMIHASRAAGKVTVAPAASLGNLIRRRF